MKSLRVVNYRENGTVECVATLTLTKNLQIAEEEKRHATVKKIVDPKGDKKNYAVEWKQDGLTEGFRV